EAVALHHAAEAPALADRGHVDELALGEDVDADLLADLVLADVVEAQLDQLHPRLDPGLRVLAGDGLGQLAGLLRPERHLERAVAVALRCLDLDHAARADAQDRDRDDPVLVVPDLRHADLLADDRSCRHGGCVSLCLDPRIASAGPTTRRVEAKSVRFTGTLRSGGPAERCTRLCRVVPGGAGPARTSIGRTSRVRQEPGNRFRAR